MNMEIRTKRLRLKPLGTQFLETTSRYSTDIENTRFMVYLPKRDWKETEEFLADVEKEWKKENPSFFEFAVMLGEKHIGAVSAYKEDNQTCELGWIIDKAYWGNGYAAEAAGALLESCVEKLGVRHFIAHCDSENTASKRVMEKLGMQFAASSWGRKNRASDEVREEYLFDLMIQREENR